MPRNLRNTAFMQAMSYQRIWTSLHKGVQGTAMPRWENTLTDDQIREVITYVLSLTAPTDADGKFIRPTAAAVEGTGNNSEGASGVYGNAAGGPMGSSGNSATDNNGSTAMLGNPAPSGRTGNMPPSAAPAGNAQASATPSGSL